MKTKAKRTKHNPFRLAVEATADVSACYQTGLQAFGKYSSKIEMTDSKKCDGSLNIDECTVEKHPQDNRWDYAVSYNSKVIFVEIHSAQTSAVRVVLKKLRWLKDWLNESAPEIKKLQTKDQPFIWLQSGKFDILPRSPQAKQLAEAGLRPISKLILK